MTPVYHLYHNYDDNGDADADDNDDDNDDMMSSPYQMPVQSDRLLPLCRLCRVSQPVLGPAD